jgi:peroxiredoxin Q/BCP
MLQVGDKAPDFDLMADDNKQVRLKDLKGKTVILYFYPKDDTPGCTKEACAFRDDYDKLSKKAVLLGVSLDDVKSHQKFKTKFDLPFRLLSDQSAAISKAYDVYKQKSMYGRSFWGIERSTFIIGPDGKIRSIFPRVKVDKHHLEVMTALG